MVIGKWQIVGLNNRKQINKQSFSKQFSENTHYTISLPWINNKVTKARTVAAQ